ncbi:MAG: hypothetical protein Q8M11_07735 [Sulfuritalea sp.]|nr:hypothetical protein [Sulfuritalea sp.]MDP1984374.1 hypothetical protein [Sulfuritalea sp.]
MDTKTLADAAAKDQTGWITEEYHGKQMHVCAVLRAPENAELAGHGQQWTFTVRIGENGTGPTDDKSDSATSDPGCFYSTQAVAEDMGFLRGRELIEGT